MGYYIRPTSNRAITGRFSGAGDGVRTRDPKLGKLVLYQLSYTRKKTFYLIRDFGYNVKEHYRGISTKGILKDIHMTLTTFQEFETIAHDANLAPVTDTVSVDMDTPISIYLKVASGSHSFLLESLEGGEKWGRYSFIGLSPILVFGSKGRQVFQEYAGEERQWQDSTDPLQDFQRILAQFRPAHIPLSEPPRFSGGAVGYLGYDMVRFMERLPERLTNNTGFNDSVFMVPRLVLAHDNIKHTLQIICWARLDGSPLNKIYEKAVEDVRQVRNRLLQGCPYPSDSITETTYLTPEVEQSVFEADVRKAKEYIRAGDIIQVVLSQRFSGRNRIPLFDIYRALRCINPSPYLYFLQMGDESMAGSSPEILVRLTNRHIELRPIAGTRPRGRDDAEDKRLEKELLADPKERAEHLMLVDLGRNDVGRVARLGTVKVSELMHIERYSHVMHIVSNVTGELDEGLDMFHVLKACFPAGTVSGAPKIRAMEIIEELEHTRRGPYAGAAGYMDFSGNMDMAITIRTLCQKGDQLYLQAGAGIVADSDPAKEWEETINKGKALMKAIDKAQGSKLDKGI